jgi:hypothetical protein
LPAVHRRDEHCAAVSFCLQLLASSLNSRNGISLPAQRTIFTDPLTKRIIDMLFSGRQKHASFRPESKDNKGFLYRLFEGPFLAGNSERILKQAVLISAGGACGSPSSASATMEYPMAKRLNVTDDIVATNILLCLLLAVDEDPEVSGDARAALVKLSKRPLSDLPGRTNALPAGKGFLFGYPPLDFHLN